jgi:ariadne-1
LILAWAADPVAVYKRAGLKYKLTDEPDTLLGASTALCPFCDEVKALANTHALACGHRFCEGCWEQWVHAAFDKGAECIFTECPAFKCKLVVPGPLFSRLLSEDKRAKFTQWLAVAFIRGNNCMRWCPKPGCDKAVEYRGGATGLKTVECVCGYEFCFSCGVEAHDPSPCKAVEVCTPQILPAQHAEHAQHAAEYE